MSVQLIYRTEAYSDTYSDDYGFYTTDVDLDEVATSADVEASGTTVEVT